MSGDVREKVEQVFCEIAVNHDFDIDTMQIAQDHVHLFISFFPQGKHIEGSMDDKEYQCECNIS